MFRLPPLTPFIRALLITLASLFVIEAILQNFLGVPVFQLLALNPSALSVATVWQVFTHVLVVPAQPDFIFSLLLSLLFIWWIMAPFEARYGRTRVIQLSIVGALSAAAGAILASQVAPAYGSLVFGPQTITVAGMCAYAMLLPPHAELNFFGMFQMRPMQLIYVVAGFSVLNFLTSKNVAQLSADLGAIAGGIAFAKLWMLRAPRRKIFGGGKPKKKGGPSLKLIKGEEDDEPKRWLN